MMQVSVRSFDGTGGGEAAGFIPRASGVSIMEELNGDGSVTFTAPLSSTGVASLVAMQQAMFVVYIDGVAVDAWGMLSDDADDLTDEAADARPVTFTGTGLRRMLADSVVGLADITAAERTYTTRTPGYILRDLFDLARGRGGFLEIVPGFDALVPTDPTGPWAATDVTRTYAAASTVLDVLDGLVQDGLVDSRMRGYQFDVFNKDDTATGLDRLRPAVQLQRGWYRTAQRRQSRALLASSIGGYVDATYNAVGGSVVPFRLIESYLEAPGLTLGKSPTLGALISAARIAGRDFRRPSTLSYLLTVGRPAPWIDYRIGDRIYADGFGDDPLRVRSMTATQTETGATEVTLELNDVQTELDLDNARKLDRIVRGVT